MISLASNAGTFHDPPPTAKQTRLPNQSSTYRTNGKKRGVEESMKKVLDRWVLAAAGTYKKGDTPGSVQQKEETLGSAQQEGETLSSIQHREETLDSAHQTGETLGNH